MNSNVQLNSGVFVNPGSSTLSVSLQQNQQHIASSTANLHSHQETMLPLSFPRISLATPFQQPATAMQMNPTANVANSRLIQQQFCATNSTAGGGRSNSLQPIIHNGRIDQVYPILPQSLSHLASVPITLATLANDTNCSMSNPIITTHLPKINSNAAVDQFAGAAQNSQKQQLSALPLSSWSSFPPHSNMSVGVDGSASAAMNLNNGECASESTLANKVFFCDRILGCIDRLRKRKARPNADRICQMMKLQYNTRASETKLCLRKLVESSLVACVDYKGNFSYRNPNKWHNKSGTNSSQVPAELKGGEGDGLASCNNHACHSKQYLAVEGLNTAKSDSKRPKYLQTTTSVIVPRQIVPLASISSMKTTQHSVLPSVHTQQPTGKRGRPVGSKKKKANSGPIVSYLFKLKSSLVLHYQLFKIYSFNLIVR